MQALRRLRNFKVVIMKTWAHFVRDLRLMMIHHQDFDYLYNSNGEILRTYDEAYNAVKYNWELYPEHFEKYVTQQGYKFEDLVERLKGKKVFDCSSLVLAFSQSEGDIYDFYVKRDYSSSGIRDLLTDVTDIPSGLWGSVLWRPGHVGIDVGNGLIVDDACEFVGVREYRFDSADGIATAFTDSGRLPWIDYSGGINL